MTALLFDYRQVLYELPDFRGYFLRRAQGVNGFYPHTLIHKSGKEGFINFGWMWMHSKEEMSSELVRWKRERGRRGVWRRVDEGGEGKRVELVPSHSETSQNSFEK